MMVLIQTVIGTKVKGAPAWLAPAPAAAYARMLAAGCPTGCITDAGRTYAEQKALYKAYLAGELTATAAYPGTSKHETGRALDLAEPARAWVRAHGAAYGWQRDRVRNEPWHMEHEATTTPAPAAPTPEPVLEDDMRDQIIAIYLNRVGGMPTPDGLSYWLSQIALGHQSLAGLDAALATSEPSKAFANLGSEEARAAQRNTTGAAWAAGSAPAGPSTVNVTGATAAQVADELAARLGM